MTGWERIKQQLELVFHSEARFHTIPAGEWDEHAEKGAKTERLSRVIDHRIHFFVGKDGSTVFTLSFEEPLLTGSEIRLVEMMLEAYRAANKKSPIAHAGEDERKAGAVRAWLLQRLEEHRLDAEMPEVLAAHFSLHAPQIPFLLYGEYSDQRKATFPELKKLLESFFGTRIMLIPLLDKEWLILGPESLLMAGSEGGKENGDEETPEESLASLCYGLHDMLAAEWVGECHLTAYYPIRPAKSLVSAIVRLREAIALGRKYRVSENIHLPWTLHLEKLLDSTGEKDKAIFLENVLKRTDGLDAETATTLETFISLDCNVSETAKKLFIHRNTLLYRLDKFKQETGLDVRTFRHALLVHIALLLYKVTKRN